MTATPSATASLGNVHSGHDQAVDRMTHRNGDQPTLDRDWAVRWYREGHLEAVCCADRRCFEPAAVVNASPQVHTPGELDTIKRTIELAMRRDPLARYCPAHANHRDTNRPWHRVRVHFPADGLIAAHTIEDAIRGVDEHHALLFAGLNWTAADRIDYLGLDDDREGGVAPVSNGYDVGKYVQIAGKPGRLTAAGDGRVDVALVDGTSWSGDPAPIEFGEGDPVDVNDPTNGATYVGTVDSYWRNGRWIVRDNRDACTCAHSGEHLTRRPEIPTTVDEADCDTYRLALHVATTDWELTAAHAGELLEIIYTQGIGRELCVNDVIDVVQDAAPDLDGVRFVDDIAAVFGYRTE